MTVERAVRLMAGIIILLSLALSHFYSHHWLWLTAFVGVNLLQSAFTNWCPSMSIFRALGLPEGEGCCGGGCGEGECCGGCCDEDGECCGGEDEGCGCGHDHAEAHSAEPATETNNPDQINPK